MICLSNKCMASNTKHAINNLTGVIFLYIFIMFLTFVIHNIDFIIHIEIYVNKNFGINNNGYI